MSVGRFLTPRQRHSRIQCEPCEYSTCCHESLCCDFFIFQEMSRRFLIYGFPGFYAVYAVYGYLW